MQSNWSFSFSGDWQDALTATKSIKGILPKELVSLDELINVGTECTPEATNVEVNANEIVIDGSARIGQFVRFNTPVLTPMIDFAPSPNSAALMKALVGNQTAWPQWLRWSARNACDQVGLTGAPKMTLTVRLDGNQASMSYSF